MKKHIEFQASKNDMSALLLRAQSTTYEDLTLVESYSKYRHRFEPGKTKIRLLPSVKGGSNWMLHIPSLQHPNGCHADPRTVRPDAQSLFTLAYEYMKNRYASRLFGRANKAGIRLLPKPKSICWAVVEDANGIKLRLLLHSHYDGSRGGANGLGHMIYEQVLRVGRDSDEAGHPLNRLDGTSLCIERQGGGDTKFPSYRVSLSDDRGPLEQLLDKTTEVEYNAICRLEDTIRIIEAEEEWKLLAKVVGDELADEIRLAQKIDAEDDDPDAEPDYSDFPKKWEI